MLLSPTGVIREIAEVQCGGAHKLEAAISRGAATVIYNNQGHEIILFPEIACGTKTKYENKQVISKGKDTTSSAFDLLEESWSSLNLTIDAKQSSLSGENGEDAQESAWREVHTKISTTINELQRALSKVDVMIAKMEATPKDQQSDRFVKTLENMHRAVEKGHVIVGDLSFLLRFKKLRTGEPISVPSAKHQQAAAASTLQEIVELAKILKSLMK